MDPLTELSNLRYSGKTDGRRHLAKFEKLVAQAYPTAGDNARWTLFLKTFDTSNLHSHQGETPGVWLAKLSRTEYWQSGRLTYQHLKSMFLDRWSRLAKDSPPSGFRMLEGPPVEKSSNQLVTTDGHKTKIEIDNSHASKNQVVLTFPDLKKRRKSAQMQVTTKQLVPHRPIEAPPSPISEGLQLEDEDTLPKDVIVVVNEEKSKASAKSNTTPEKPRLLEGKVCIVTNAAKGVGRAIVLGLAREGAQIVAHYWGNPNDSVNDDIVSLCVEVRTLGQGCSIIFGDISDPRTSDAIVRRAVETYGKLDVVVANAGITWVGSFLEMSPEILQRHNDVNLNGNFYLCQAAAKQMSIQAAALKPEDPRPDYSMICISSPNVLVGAKSKGPQYSTKAALVSLMQNCAVSLGGHGIRCNNVSPGTLQIDKAPETLDELDKKKKFELEIPLKRVGQPEDIVGPVIFLASPMAKYITGTEIVVDGGAFIGSS